MRISSARDEQWMMDGSEAAASYGVDDKRRPRGAPGLSPSSARFTFHAPRSTPQSGIALVIVMISIFVLTMLAAGFAFSMKVETKLAQHANNETQLQWVGRSGVAYAQCTLGLP